MTTARYLTTIAVLISLLSLTPIAYAQEPKDYDWIPDGHVEYVVEWPAQDMGNWSIAGRSTYKLTATEDDGNIVVDFEITYETYQVANLTIVVTNSLMIGALRQRFGGWVSNFDFISTPKTDGKDMEPANFPPFNGTGYFVQKQFDAGDKIKITGKLKLVKDKTRDLKKLDLAYLDTYPEVYIVLADIIIDTQSGDTLAPNMLSWGSLAIPLSKNNLDIIRLIAQKDEKIKELNSEVQKLNATIKDLKAELDEVKASLEPLQQENRNLKNLLEQKDKEINSVKQQLKDTEGLLYISFGLFAVLMIALVAVTFIILKK